MGELSFDELVRAGVALFVLAALIGLLIAIVITIALIGLYRYRVGRSMRIGAGAPAKALDPAPHCSPSEHARDRVHHTGRGDSTSGAGRACR